MTRQSARREKKSSQALICSEKNIYNHRKRFLSTTAHHNGFRWRRVGLKPGLRMPTCDVSHEHSNRWRPSHVEKQKQEPRSSKGSSANANPANWTRQPKHSSARYTSTVTGECHMTPWELPGHYSRTGQIQARLQILLLVQRNLLGRSLWSQEPVSHWARAVMKCINHQLLYISRADGFYL